MGPARSASRAVRLLFALRSKLGELFGWDEPGAGLGIRVPSLRERLLGDLGDAPRLDPGGLPFSPLYMTENEFAAEIANQTVHGVVHLGWVPDGDGFRGELAVYVKRNGLLGSAYMVAIAPFRHRLVYPPLLREVGRRWRASG